MRSVFMGLSHTPDSSQRLSEDARSALRVSRSTPTAFFDETGTYTLRGLTELLRSIVTSIESRIKDATGLPRPLHVAVPNGPTICPLTTTSHKSKSQPRKRHFFHVATSGETALCRGGEKSSTAALLSRRAGYVRVGGFGVHTDQNSR